MRINKNTKHTKIYIIILILGLLTVAGFVAWHFFNQGVQQVGENTVSYEPATSEQKTAGINAKEEFNKAQYNTEDKSEGVNNGVKEEVGLLISSMNQADNILTIATSIETLDDSGVCNLKLSHAGSDDVNAEVRTFKITTYSACEDFKIDVAELEKGEWNVQVDYVSSSTKGSTNTEVTIK